MPVITAAVLGAVAGPAVGWLERHRVPRIGGTVLVLLGLVAIGALIFLLVFGGISANSADISAKVNQAMDKIQAWLGDLGVDNAQGAKEGVQKAAPEVRTTLLGGLAHGISGLKSLLFFAAFATLSTLFVLKDGPIMRAFINRHMACPNPWPPSSRATRARRRIFFAARHRPRDFAAGPRPASRAGRCRAARPAVSARCGSTRDRRLPALEQLRRDVLEPGSPRLDDQRDVER